MAELTDMRDVDELLLNAELRNELERFYDESLLVIDSRRMSTHSENEYLQSILAWEEAPILPISRWFDPELILPPHEGLADAELKERLIYTLQALFDKNVILEYTGHLSDRQLYCMIARDILPEKEKRVAIPHTYLHWQCIDPVVDEENWLRFYADHEERLAWQAETGLRLPPMEDLPFPRTQPRRRPR